MENTENHNFERNIAAIKNSNPELAEYLSKITEINEDIQLLYNHLNEPILSYNGIPLHADNGAEIEARNIFKKVESTQISMHVVFGMGLGYLFQEFAQKAKGFVILYEPDLELLRFTLELADFSDELAKKNVRIVSNLNDLKQLMAENYQYKSNVTFSSLPSYRKIYEKSFAEIVGTLQATCGACISEYKTTKAFLANAADSTAENFAYLVDEIPLMEFKGQYEGKTALVVAAGPSLDMNIETIKKYRDKVVIFVVGTALKALIRNGIKPDFLNIIEYMNCFYQVDETDLSDIYFILEPSTNVLFHKTNPKLKLAYLGDTNPVNLAWGKIANVSTDGYATRGTVSFEAIASAKILGFKKIILIGQDLAYVNNRCYSKDSIFSDLVLDVNDDKKIEIKPKDFEHYKQSIVTKGSATDDMGKWFANYRIKQINDSLLFVKGVKGDMLPTEASYATFIEHFKDFAQKNPDLDLINSSMVGANIEGFKNISLEEALKDIEPISEKIVLKSDFKYDKELILTNLEREYKFFKKTLSGIEQIEPFFNKYDEAFKRTNSINEETNKFFKVLLNHYSQIRAEAATQSNLFNSIAFSEDIEIQYLLTKSEKIDAEAITEVYATLKNYYSIIKARIISIMGKIRNSKESIK